MFEKKISRDMTLTPGQAQRLLKLNTFEAQRKISTKWISQLANTIREGLFTSGHIAVAIFQNGSDERRYLINGQHQCAAVISTNQNVQVRYEEYDCHDDMEEVSLLYRQFDNYKTRSLGNIVAMEMLSLRCNWPLRIGSLVVSAAAMKEGKPFANKTEKVELLKSYLKHGDFINKIFSEDMEGDKNKNCAHLKRAPVACAMMMTWERAQLDSDKFWSAVRDGENLKKGSPALKLRDFLKESNFDRGRGSRGRRTVGQHEMISRCITAWNAWRRGGGTQLKYFPHQPVPKAI